MALSDSCGEYVQDEITALEKLMDAVSHYAAPDYPIKYGIEIRALQHLLSKFKEFPADAIHLPELHLLLAAIWNFHFCSPRDPANPKLRQELDEISRRCLGEDPSDNS